MTKSLSIPDRFDRAVDYYTAYRTRYAPELFNWLLRETATLSDAHVLDLGCGPGFIANALGPQVGRVTGVDPSAAMLEAARADAPANVSYLQGTSADLSIVDGPVDLVTMGRSFHWMDRAATLVDLDSRITQDGALAFLHDKPIQGPCNQWWFDLQKIGKAHAKPDQSTILRHSDQWEPHETILLASPFCNIRRIMLYQRHAWDYDSLLGNFLSRSSTTPEVLGADGLIAFETKLKEAFDAIVAARGKQPLETLNEHVVLIAERG